MNITFLVGNGFDLSAGLRTAYRDFYDWYCAQPSGNLDIQMFKNGIRDDVLHGGETWANFELGLGQYAAHFSGERLVKFQECYADAQAQTRELQPQGCAGRDRNRRICFRSA